MQLLHWLSSHHQITCKWIGIDSLTQVRVYYANRTLSFFIFSIIILDVCIYFLQRIIVKIILHVPTLHFKSHKKQKLIKHIGQKLFGNHVVSR